MLRRLVKMFVALGAGIGVTCVVQFALPPLFLHLYGVDIYGEWLVLSAAVSYLSTLNFGISTYASNELAILHQRGQSERYREVQASTLLLLLAFVTLGITLCAGVYSLPFHAMLHLGHVENAVAKWTVFLLGVQVMVQIVGGYFSSLFVVVGKAHRGLGWYNLRRLCAVLGGVPMLLLRVPLSWVALGQLIAVTLTTIASIVDLKFAMRELPLGLRGARWQTVRESIAPSGLFGLAFMQYFLVYQAPVIVLQWILGPAHVVLFSIARTILSVPRQFLQTITEAIRPEITMAYGARQMQKLLAIFHASEKVIYFLVPVANMGAFLLSPLLVRLWLHRDNLFDLPVYGILALISCVISMREHKQYFHYSTNTHRRYSLIVFFANIGMILISIPATMAFGLHGLLYVWLTSEVSQMLLIYQENKILFHRDCSVNLASARRMLLVLITAFPLCSGLVWWSKVHATWEMAAAGVLGIAVLTMVSYSVFDVREVKDQLTERIRGRWKIGSIPMGS